jgi:hypothetical protein
MLKTFWKRLCDLTLPTFRGRRKQETLPELLQLLRWQLLSQNNADNAMATTNQTQAQATPSPTKLMASKST